jgi:hypothetical protein
MTRIGDQDFQDERMTRIWAGMQDGAISSSNYMVNQMRPEGWGKDHSRPLLAKGGEPHPPAPGATRSRASGLKKSSDKYDKYLKHQLYIWKIRYTFGVWKN